MKPLWKYTISTVAALLLGLLLVSVVLPNEYRSQEQIEIRVPASGLFRVLTSFDTYPEWYFDSEDGIDITISQIEGTNRFRLDWNSNRNHVKGGIVLSELGGSRSGDIFQKIKLISDRDQDHRFLEVEEFEIASGSGSLLKLTWTRVRYFSFPYNILVWKRDYKSTHTNLHRRAVDRLENYLKSNFPTNVFDGFEITRTIRTDFHLLVSESEMVSIPGSGFADEMFNDLAEYVGKNNLVSAGMPMGILFSSEFSDSLLKCMAIPMRDSLPSRDFRYKKIEGGMALQVLFSGSNEMSNRATAALEEYIHTYDILIREPIIEQYFYDPRIHSDTSARRTVRMVFID